MASPRQPGRLVRSLTIIPAASVILANVIGTGIYVKTRVMTCNVGDPNTVLAVWVVAGFLSLAGAMVYAELGTLMPRAGGEFNFIGATYGRLAAFLFGWTRTVAVGASLAASAIVLVIFLNDLVGGSLSPPLLLGLPVAFIALTTALNLASARANGAMATVLTGAKVSLIVGVAVGAFLLADGAWSHFAVSGASGTCDGVPDSARLGVTGFGAAMLGALWAYNGWNVIAMLGSEVRDPGRTLPRALIGGTVLIMVLYVAVNAAYFYVLSPEEVAGLPETASVAMEVVMRFAGAGAVAVLAAALMLSAYGTLHTTMLTSPRLPYALARRDLLPRALTAVSVRGVPVTAVLVMATWATVLALSGTYDILTDIYIFVLWIFYGMSGAALFMLRRAHPNAERPYQVWGYPVMPALFLVVTVYLLVNTLVATPGRAIAGLGLIAAGLPVYAYFKRRAGDDSATWLGMDEG